MVKVIGLPKSRPKRSQEHLDTIVTQLKKRRLRGHKAFRKASQKEKFYQYGLVRKFDPHNPDTSNLKLCFLRKRSKVIEIVSAEELVFGLTATGVCTAFTRVTAERVCFLNIAPDEVIRSLFYNKANGSLITVSVYREDNYSSLKCRSTSLEYIRRRQPASGFGIFESESLKWPGFVEFDDVNGKVLTYSATNKVYKVWELVNYTLLYSIGDRDIQEIKISPGIMLLIYGRRELQDDGSTEETGKGAKKRCVVPLKILGIDTGEVLKSFNHDVKSSKKVDFIEQFNEKLLVKQENENLHIVDVRTSESLQVSSTDFTTPSAFIFLYENQLFLTFRQHSVSVWNFQGELVTTFKDHQLWYPDCNTNNIYITSQQDLIISYCKSESGEEGSLNVSDILTGDCLAKVEVDKTKVNLAEQKNALEEVTSLYYNEEMNEIYTGNKHGLIYCWTHT